MQRETENDFAPAPPPSPQELVRRKCSVCGVTTTGYCTVYDFRRRYCQSTRKDGKPGYCGGNMIELERGRLA